MGALLYEAATYVLRPVGTFLVWIFVLVASIQLLSGASWGALGKRLRSHAVDLLAKYRERMARRRSRPAATKEEKRPEKRKEPESKKEKEKKERLRWPKLFGGSEPEEEAAEKAREEPQKDVEVERREKAEPAIAGDAAVAPLAMSAPAKPNFGAARVGTQGASVPAVPSLSLLKAAEEASNGTPGEDLEARGDTLTACLAEFGIQGEVRRITPGPVVTMFEYKPGPGVKISRIENLSDDLALAMKALAGAHPGPHSG